jgi:hypothetical protein
VGARLGYSPEALAEANRAAVVLLERVRADAMARTCAPLFNAGIGAST